MNPFVSISISFFFFIFFSSFCNIWLCEKEFVEYFRGGVSVRFWPKDGTSYIVYNKNRTVIVDMLFFKLKKICSKLMMGYSF